MNPLEQILEVYCRTGNFWQEVDTYAGDQKVRAVPFDAVELDMARWWDEGVAAITTSHEKPGSARASRPPSEQFSSSMIVSLWCWRRSSERGSGAMIERYALASGRISQELVIWKR